MAKKATAKRTTTGKKTRSSKARGGRATGTAVAEPQRKRSRTSRRKEPALTHEQIALRAQEIWRERGFPHGEDKDHWYEAERQLKREKGG